MFVRCVCLFMWQAFKMNISTTNMMNQVQSEEIVKAIWRNADAVSFDVDSTICEDEAIDELADFFGVGEQVAAM